MEQGICRLLFPMTMSLSMHTLVLADDSVYGDTPGSRAISFAKEGVFHIISPGSCLCARGGRQNQPSLAHCLAIETHPLLLQMLAQMNQVQVIFINGHEMSVVKDLPKYEQMSLYRQEMQLPETMFTNRSFVLCLLLVV